MAETSQQNSASATASVQPPRKGFEELESALPPLQEDFLKFPEEEPLPPDTGIPPALYQARETSLAPALNRSTPVPRLVDREQMIPTANYPQKDQPPSQPTNPEGMKPNASPSLALFPPIQNPRREESSGLMDLIPEEMELTGLINLFNDQFDMFFRARETQNTASMKRLLSQALMTQEMIIELVGRADAICLCQEWIPSKELHQLNQYLAQQNPADQTIRHHSQLAVAPHANYQPMIATPTPEPTGLQYQVLAQKFQVPTPSNRQELPQPRPEGQTYHGPQMPQPPPPPPPPQALQVVQLFRPSPHYQPGGVNPPHYPHTPHGYADHNPPHPQDNWRGSGRNWRRPQDNTQKVL
ncbi:hypothetical protein PTTG_11141, partial [Puccinia triticina 1-1 BBBD Race 1]